MLDRTEKRVGQTWERKRSGGWEKGNKKGKGKISTYLDNMRQSFLLNLALLPTSGNV